MIRDLDLSLKALLSGKAVGGEELDLAEISFSVPDEEWRSTGTGLHLNVYLYDIRENRNLRSNERQRIHHANGAVTHRKSPPRIDCNYIITAWNKETASPNPDSDSDKEDKELQEHRLLSQVLGVLLRCPLIPPKYLHGSLVNQEPDLPMVTAQKDGLTDPVEFWSALGAPLKPSINCVVTLAMEAEEEPVDYIVTTSIITYKKKKQPGVYQEDIRIGGRVTDKDHPDSGIAGVEVFIPGLKKRATSDGKGYFTFYKLQRGKFKCTAQKEGYRAAEVALEIPAPEGKNYDIQLSKS